MFRFVVSFRNHILCERSAAADDAADDAAANAKNWFGIETGILAGEKIQTKIALAIFVIFCPDDYIINWSSF